jgi:hypothetical protein
MKNVGIFYGHLEYCAAICYNVWPFGIFCGHLVHFSCFWYAVLRKIWQPCSAGDPAFFPLIATVLFGVPQTCQPLPDEMV